MIKKSSKLDNVLYDIRGPVLEEAKRLEEEGYQILKLNTCNPAPFGLFAPDEVLHDMIINISNTQGYSDSKGLFQARKAVMQYCQQKGIGGVDINDIFIGNGVSEVVVMALQALLDGDEILCHHGLSCGLLHKPVGGTGHYICDKESLCIGHR